MSLKNPNKIPKIPLSHSVTWFVCRLLLLIWGIVYLFLGSTTQFLQSLFAIAFTHLWDMFQLWGGDTFITKVNYRFQTQLNIFICLGCVVGTTLNKQTDIEFVDDILHFFAGFIASSAMYEFSELINGQKRQTGPAMKAMFSLLGGVTLLVGWEIYEFSMDRIYGMNLQCSSPFSESGLIDTMLDLIFGTVGALCSMLFNIHKTIKNTKRSGKDDFLCEDSKDSQDKP